MAVSKDSVSSRNDGTETEKSSTSLGEELNKLSRNQQENDSLLPPHLKSPSGLSFASEATWHAYGKGLASISLDDNNEENVTEKKRKLKGKRPTSNNKSDSKDSLKDQSQVDVSLKSQGSWAVTDFDASFGAPGTENGTNQKKSEYLHGKLDNLTNDSIKIAGNLDSSVFDLQSSSGSSNSSGLRREKSSDSISAAKVQVNPSVGIKRIDKARSSTHTRKTVKNETSVHTSTSIQSESTMKTLSSHCAISKQKSFRTLDAEKEDGIENQIFSVIEGSSKHSKHSLRRSRSNDLDDLVNKPRTELGRSISGGLKRAGSFSRRGSKNTAESSPDTTTPIIGPDSSSKAPSSNDDQQNTAQKITLDKSHDSLLSDLSGSNSNRGNANRQRRRSQSRNRKARSLGSTNSSTKESTSTSESASSIDTPQNVTPVNKVTSDGKVVKEKGFSSNHLPRQRSFDFSPSEGISKGGTSVSSNEKLERQRSVRRARSGGLVRISDRRRGIRRSRSNDLSEISRDSSTGDVSSAASLSSLSQTPSTPGRNTRSMRRSRSNDLLETSDESSTPSTPGRNSRGGRRSRSNELTSSRQGGSFNNNIRNVSSGRSPGRLPRRRGSNDSDDILKRNAARRRGSNESDGVLSSGNLRRRGSNESDDVLNSSRNLRRRGSNESVDSALSSRNLRRRGSNESVENSLGSSKASLNNPFNPGESLRIVTRTKPPREEEETTILNKNEQQQQQQQFMTETKQSSMSKLQPSRLEIRKPMSFRKGEIMMRSSSSSTEKKEQKSGYITSFLGSKN